MICEKCQKNHATVHLTEIINSEKREAHLCEECARGAGVGLKFNFTISDILGSLVEGAKPAKGSKAGANLKCPQCGMSYADFRAKARIGCANDYEVFKSGVVPLLEKIHGNTQHVGKIPKTADDQVQKENELARLKRELDSLIKNENYERAAEIRDRIHVLEVDLGPR